MARRVFVSSILDHISAHSGLSVETIIGPCRKRNIMRFRFMGYYLARELTPLSLPQIGRIFGDRDHSTILHGIDAFKNIMEREPRFRSLCAVIRFALYSGFDPIIDRASEPEPEPEPAPVLPEKVSEELVAKLMRKPVPQFREEPEYDDSIDDMELLSRGVAAYLAERAAA